MLHKYRGMKNNVLHLLLRVVHFKRMDTNKDDDDDDDDAAAAAPVPVVDWRFLSNIIQYNVLYLQYQLGYY
jgi:hypothetical protein